MRFLRRPSLRATVARLIAPLAASLLLACAVVVSPDIRFTRTPSAGAAPQASAVIGLYSRVSEGPLTYNVGVRIASIDGSDIADWQGAVVEAGTRKLVVRFEAAYPQKTDDVALTLSARPGRTYLVRASNSSGSVTDRTFRFWIEDAATREVVVGVKQAPAAAFDATAAAQALYSQFREALAGAVR